MRGFVERKSWILHTILAITIVIGLVFASGCENLNLGGTQVADFGGNSPSAQEMQKCFFNKYGDPAAYAGPPRFLEPMVSDGISDNLPTDKVTSFSKDTPNVYVWAFYEGFKKGDTITTVWTFNGQQYASLSKPVAGNYGIVYGQFDKPNSGWALGTHTITISGNGVQGSATFDIIDGQTRTVPLPCQEVGGQDGHNVKPDTGGMPHEITTGPTIVGWVTGATCTYMIVSVWGSKGSGSGEFEFPRGVAVDSMGNVYVADTGNNRIQKFDSNGNYLGKRKDQMSGGYRMLLPTAVAVDSERNVYVSDSENNRIQKFDSDGNYLLMWGGKGTGPGQFTMPKGIAVDSERNVYVSDSYYPSISRIQKFDSDGNYRRMWGTLGTGEGQLSDPNGIAVDSAGNIYVAEKGNHRIQKFDSNTNYLLMWGGKGSTESRFIFPVGIAVDSERNVYVADSGNNRIQKFDSDGNYLLTWGTKGTGVGQFSQPFGIAVDSERNVYVADSGNNRIQKFKCIVGTSPTPALTSPQGSVTTTLTPPLAVHLQTTPTISYACWTPAVAKPPTLYPSTPPTTTPTTVPTTPHMIYLNTTPIPHYTGYSY